MDFRASYLRQEHLDDVKDKLKSLRQSWLSQNHSRMVKVSYG